MVVTFLAGIEDAVATLLEMAVGTAVEGTDILPVAFLPWINDVVATALELTVS